MGRLGPTWSILAAKLDRANGRFVHSPPAGTRAAPPYAPEGRPGPANPTEEWCLADLSAPGNPRCPRFPDRVQSPDHLYPLARDSGQG